ncbi:MAG: hypothetical protein Kow0081_1020 [Candidatus Dojkabacteria bacterium]
MNLNMFTNDVKKLMNQINSLVPKFCDKCGMRHHSDDMEIVRNTPTNLLCKLSCKNCGNTYVFSINKPVDGMGIVSGRRAPFKSEITAKELNKFTSTEVSLINPDELIEVFQGLEEVQTIEDFNNLF